VFGPYEEFQNDPYFRDYIPFHEYFHGDAGRGVGASHQTGWTGLIAKLLQPRRESVWIPVRSFNNERKSATRKLSDGHVAGHRHIEASRGRKPS
jgi:hypothetical protein